jgi:Raf kinase inhibitor-like YbhB/YbcL family protein
MRKLLMQSALIALALGGLAGSATAQTPAPTVAADFLAPTVAQGAAEGVTTMLKVTSPAVKEGEAIKDKYSAWHANVALPVTWEKGPDGTKSFAIVLEDVIPGRPNTVQHWIVYNIPGNKLRLPEGMPQGNRYYAMAIGALQATSGDIVGYRGPRPPAGTTHNYALQVFALDTKLDMAPGDANIASITEAMKGHVLAYGQLNATYTNTAAQ